MYARKFERMCVVQCVCEGVPRSNSPRQGRTQRRVHVRMYRHTFERIEQHKNKKKNLQKFLHKGFLNKNTKHTHTHTHTHTHKKNIYTNKIFTKTQNKIFTQKYFQKHQIKYLHKNIYKKTK
jgi:hypothetical protein